MDAAEDAIASVGAVPDDEFNQVVDGFAVDLTAAQAQSLEALPQITAVTADQTFAIAASQVPPPSWGLDRLDQTGLPLDSRFTYPDGAGAGVRVYVVDTGVSANPALGGRLAAGYTAVSDGLGTNDCVGHGTHVAGTIAATSFGVAKAATVVPVRVLNCGGTGTTTSVIAGLDWIALDHSAGTPGVVNLSLSGPLDTALNAAIAGLVDDGLTVVVAAGNDDVDACSASPASAPAALTVGATTRTDAAAYFSNWGPCLDLFAPGVGIVSLDASNPAGSLTKDGTSMAAPHVSGAAALYLGQFPASSPNQTSSALIGMAELAVTSAGATTTTRLVSSNASVLPGAVTSLRVAGTTARSLTVTWRAPAFGPTADAYDVTVRAPGSAIGSVVATTSTGTVLGGLTPGTTYQISVTSRSSAGTGAAVGPISAATAREPSATETYVTSVYGKLFSRAPDPTGLATWTSALSSGVPRRAVADAITASAEYRSGLIREAYQHYLVREPDPAGLQNWLAAMGSGMTIQEMESGFVASAEYYARSGGTPAGWVTALYGDVLGRRAAESEVTFWTSRLATGYSRSSVALGFLLSTEHLASVIDGHYEHLLDRGIDSSGLTTWVGQIQAGVRIESVIGGIIASDEYYAKNS